jgi:hypothetical protein
VSHRAKPGTTPRTGSARAFLLFSAFRSHIERLAAAYTLAGTKFFRDLQGIRG